MEPSMSGPMTLCIIVRMMGDESAVDLPGRLCVPFDLIGEPHGSLNSPRHLFRSGLHRTVDNDA